MMLDASPRAFDVVMMVFDAWVVGVVALAIWLAVRGVRYFINVRNT